MLPLSETWVYTFLNSFNDFAVKAAFPLFLLSFLLILYSVLMRITKSRLISLVSIFALVSLKQVSDYSTVGLTDLLQGIYFGVCFFYLCSWINEKRPVFLKRAERPSLFAIKDSFNKAAKKLNAVFCGKAADRNVSGLFCDHLCIDS